MKTFFNFLNWIFAFVFFLLFILSMAANHFLPSIFIILIITMLIPPIRKWLGKKMHFPIPVWLRTILIPLFFILFIFSIFLGMGNEHSIYKNPEIEKKLMTIYDEKMSQWPVLHESKYIETSYGKVHIIISGPDEAPPVILLHASAVSSWSWIYNVKMLNKHYRTYLIDTIGDAGRSVLTDITKFPDTGEELATFYSEIMDSLKIKSASFIGASQGGFISTDMALYAPERVSKVILAGPMGYTGTTESVIRIIFATLFPIDFIQQYTTLWAFGNDPGIKMLIHEWFPLILEGVISRQARPHSFTKEQLQSITVPILLILGERDALVGNPQNAVRLVEGIPNFRIETLDTGHLIAAERPIEFNNLVLGFLGKPEL